MKKFLTVFAILLLLGIGGYWYAEKKMFENKVTTEIAENSDPSLADTAYIDSTINEEEILNDDDSENEEALTTLGELDEESFKKWKGEYYAEYFDEKEKKENTPIKISIKMNETDMANIDIWRYPQDKSSIREASYFGSFEPLNKDNNSLLFVPQVLSGNIIDGFEGKMEDAFMLDEKGGTFFIKTKYLSKSGNFIELPIKKIK